MTQKHLHELLKQDQEPFHLKTFIQDRRTLLKPAQKTSIVVKKPKPIIESKSFNTFCINHVCFLSSNDSPGFKTSPFLDFPAKELKSPCNNATMFINIPARTAAMLLDAATRVQKPKPGFGSGSGSGSPGSGSKFKNIRFGLLGSFLQRLKDRSTRTKRRGIDSGTERNKKSFCDDGRSCTGEWSEKVLGVETSCSSRLDDEFDEIECLCSDSSSPFRFSLQRSPSPDRRKQDLLSPVVSPSDQLRQDKESYEVGCSEEINRQNDDEKEQCSPVSVLDPLFDDDEEERDGGPTEEDGYDIERSYANVQRAKHQLLQKLKRFERLAELDPIQLENCMLEQRYDEDEDVLANEEEVTNEEYFMEIVNHLGIGKIPWYMRKLICDLIEEENKKEEHAMVVQRVCKRLRLWKVVELYTIDMIVETDFRNEGWKWCDGETIRDMGVDIERDIFGFLLEELAQELAF
ncbi:uncharacterized protein LOC110891355 isoform X2 [Helianthus annuus]|uniref:uncharacterized protein LOC110891355 isoform X2 n=1 Tax=Helianthus annuus TaxID=4232 RepID=UPI000B90A305|nr:uncharacterized protein LOC110891355 isoform X2 [Helianthus annuus]